MQKLGASRLRVGSPAKSEYGSLLQLGGAAQGGTKLVGFNLAEIRFTQALENLRDRDAGGFFDAIVEVHKTPGELACEEGANSGFTGTHESGETENRHTRKAARRRCSCHAKEARRAKVGTALIALQDSNCTTVGGEFDLGQTGPNGTKQRTERLQMAANCTMGVRLEICSGLIVHSAHGGLRF